VKWIFITAGVGSSDFESAADRVASGMKGFNLFDEIRVFKSSDVRLFAPEIHSWYSEDELSGLKGYGWYVWKSRFAKEAIHSDSGNFDGIMYLDAGCEVFLSGFSKLRLKKYMKIAERTGSCLFKISTPERFYTKKLLIDRFQGTSVDGDLSQFQSGSWLFTGDLARHFLTAWDEIVWEDKRFTDESVSPGGEVQGFVCNRYDQAVFSMVAKSLSLKACGDVPPGDISRFKSRVRLFFYPFAWARNRHGNSLISSRFRSFGRISLVLSVFLDRRNRRDGSVQ
jgi:hypothetical protein